jgi:predicted RNA-binding protein with PUA domain
MPIWLRNFTFKKLEEYFKKQEEVQNKANNQLKNSKEIARPNINPANVYNTSVPTKK